MPNTLTDTDWTVLLRWIKDGRCTPFLGAGASAEALPSGSAIARKWAKEYGYPFEDDGDLVRVAQFVAVYYDALFPKAELLRQFKGVILPSYNPYDEAANEAHGVLAELPLPLFLTTNYDDFMLQALRRQDKDPRQELCRWNTEIRNEKTVFDKEPGYQPTVAQPLIFHLHGHTQPESLVLTEDDYLRFLAAMARETDLLPPPVQKALATTSLVFIGYRLADWNFRVLLQGLRPTAQRLSVVVLKPPEGTQEMRQKVQEYMDRYYAAMALRVYWGTAREFCGELRRRWREFEKKVRAGNN